MLLKINYVELGSKDIFLFGTMKKNFLLVDPVIRSLGFAARLGLFRSLFWSMPKISEKESVFADKQNQELDAFNDMHDAYREAIK